MAETAALRVADRFDYAEKSHQTTIAFRAGVALGQRNVVPPRDSEWHDMADAKHLVEADRHVADLHCRIAQQRRLICRATTRWSAAVIKPLSTYCALCFRKTGIQVLETNASKWSRQTRCQLQRQGLRTKSRQFAAICQPRGCGFCTPGTLAVVQDLLRRCPLPTETGNRAAISAVIFRCTGYRDVVGRSSCGQSHAERERRADTVRLGPPARVTPAAADRRDRAGRRPED